MALRVPRRVLMVSGAAAAAIAWTEVIWPRLAGQVGTDLRLEPIDGLPGYRRAQLAGSISSGPVDPFVGLVQPASTEVTELPAAEPPQDPCQVLYGPRDLSRVQMAVFTDFNCPNCRVLDRIVLDLARKRPNEVTVRIQQLPLLGESSLWAARGALAAERQGAYTAFHKRLMGAAFSVSPAYLQSVAEDMGLDKDQLMTDATGAEVTRQLADVRSLAARLGVFGTPGLLVGRTLVMGNVAEGVINQLIALEASEPLAPNCTVFA